MTGRVEARGVDRLRRYDDLICALLRAEEVVWTGQEGDLEIEEFLTRVAFHGVGSLLNDRFQSRMDGQWPKAIRDRCRSEAVLCTSWNLAQLVEIRKLLTAFRAAGIKPLLLKGVALAYTHYPQPGLRPRGDLDFLVDRQDKERGEEVLRSLGYLRHGVPMGNLIAHEAEWSVVDKWGVELVVDFHWRSRSSPILGRVLSYAEMEARSVAVAALGPDAFTPCPVHSLSFAIIHRAGHQNSPYYVNGAPFPARERLIWLYDIHLLASKMSLAEIQETASLAIERRIAKISWEALCLCNERFGLQVPKAIIQSLNSIEGDEPSSRFLRGGRLRQFFGEFLSLSGVRERTGWLSELAFPAPEYMRWKYTEEGHHWLPALYARRAIGGLRKMLN